MNDWIEAAAAEIADYFGDLNDAEYVAAIIRQHFGCLTAQELHSMLLSKAQEMNHCPKCGGYSCTVCIGPTGPPIYSCEQVTK